MQAWVIGNWKQNPATSHDVDSLLTNLLTAMDSKNAKDITKECHLMVAPSCIHVANVSKHLQDTPILCAAQNISAHSDTVGAFTGDCSAQQVADAGATWTIIGHSERRQYHQESNDTLLQKLSCAFKQSLGAVFCIGETQEQYDAKETLEVIDNQLSVIKNLLIQQPELAATLSKHLLIAYEPVWAIGTGKVPTVSEVSATHEHIKNTVAEFVTSLSRVTVLYGGSVNVQNCNDFAADPMIDGALVGGASLNVDSFLAIAKAFSNGHSK